MDKDFGLDGHSAGDGGDLAAAHLAGQHHPGKAQLLGLPGAGNVVDCQLGGGVQRHLGSSPAHQRRYAQVLHDQRVDAVLAGDLQRAQHRLILAVIDHGVDRHVHLDPTLLADAGGLCKRLLVEVFGVAPGV